MKKIKLIGIFCLLLGIGIPTFFLLKKTWEEQVEIVYLDTLIQNKEEYFAILEIPKISLKKELFPIHDSRNQVDQNILVHEKSIFPESTSSHVILAGHSGVGANAFFKDLHLLDVGDEILLYYNNQIYIYQIELIEVQSKTGSLSIIQNDSDMITLITCTYQDNDTQTIYYGVCKRIENIP